MWGIAACPGKKGFVSVGSDKTVKFWDFELVGDDGKRTKVLSALHKRTLSLDEGVTARGQTDTDNPAEYGFIRKRIIPLGIKRIAKKIIRFRLLP